MINDNKQMLRIIIILFTLTCLILFLFVSPKSDLELCREIFKGFVEGNQTFENYVDWENLKAVGIDAGEIYRKFPSAKERKDYRKEFYKNFSSSVKRIGGRFEYMANWRVYSKSPTETIIATDYTAGSKTLLFTLSGAGKKKLTSFKWEGKN